MTPYATYSVDRIIRRIYLCKRSPRPQVVCQSKFCTVHCTEYVQRSWPVAVCVPDPVKQRTDLTVMVLRMFHRSPPRGAHGPRTRGFTVRDLGHAPLVPMDAFMPWGTLTYPIWSLASHASLTTQPNLLAGIYRILDTR